MGVSRRRSRHRGLRLATRMLFGRTGGMERLRLPDDHNHGVVRVVTTNIEHRSLLVHHTLNHPASQPLPW